MSEIKGCIGTLQKESVYFTMQSMATYAIGDIQGCADSLCALVHRLPFHPRRDRLWFVGDLVNRGPKSAEVIRMIRAAGPQAQVVLGNHDLHLLAVASGARPLQASDTLQDIFKSADAKDLIEWVRHQPLAHAEAKTLMIHAGVMPQWSMQKTLLLAAEVEKRLRSAHWQDFMHEVYGNSPGHWKDSLRGAARFRMVVNVLTRLRYIRPDGSLDFKFKLSPSQAPAELKPWFSVAHRLTRRQRLVFGHWSTLGLLRLPGLLGIDTGCAWRGYLSAVRLEDEAVFQQPALEGMLR